MTSKIQRDTALEGEHNFGDMGRGDRHQFVFKTNIVGTGREENSGCWPDEGVIMKRVDMFQSYPKTQVVRTSRDEEQGRD